MGWRPSAVVDLASVAATSSSPDSSSLSGSRSRSIRGRHRCVEFDCVIHNVSCTVTDLMLKGAYSQTEISKNTIRVSELKKGVQTGLATSGWERKLRNVIYQYLQVNPLSIHPLATPPEHMKEPLLYLRKAQQAWEKRILKSLNSMCTELNIPLARKRPDKEQRDLLSRWTELGTDGPVYAPKDFLDVIMALQNPNYNTGDSTGDMAINQCQTGVDDVDIPPEMFDADRMKLGRKVITADHGPLAQEYAKKGCPISLRGDLWCQILGVIIDEFDVLYYEQLKSNVIAHDLLVDSLLYKDVKLTATNDDQYFVFEDFLYQSYIRGKLGDENFAVVYPPNGVIPFHGFAMYVAPLCYLYQEPVKLYYVFREIYTRYFFRLHSISSHPQGIVCLSLLFENLLQMHEAELFFHLKSVGCQPLRIAFKWLVRAFSGYLHSDQVLLLWDRVLAYNSLEILPVLAVSIFSFRKTNLLKVQSYNAAEAVLADLTTLQVIPLVQLSLFSK
ncbi:TBC19-like protein [Mya arenaria]|uniref:TBC19-like protein n=1 Tax=Mya arenaria TaxID=6604 RepID=A0ABY7DPC0_MYAAR|nr:TBC19-like protein [Mya arenaria]